MSRVADSAWAFLIRDFRIARSQRLAFVLEIASAAFTVMTFFLVGRLVDPDAVSGGYFTFATVGLALSTLLQSGAVVIAGNVRQDQIQGTLETVLSTGCSVPVLAVGMAIYPFLAAAVRALLYFALAVAFGAEAPNANWALGVVAMGLGAISFTGLGLAGAAFVLILRAAVTATSWLIALLTLAAGVLFPPHLLPDWVRWLARLSPFTHTLELSRRAILHGAGWADAWPSLALLAVLGVVFAAGGVLALAAGLSWGRRRGTLARY